jgi:hypothetical protein
LARFDLLGILRPMKKARVIVKTTASIHQIYVEHNGERTLYAVTDKLPMAKALVLKAKRELGIARGSGSSGHLSQDASRRSF